MGEPIDEGAGGSRGCPVCGASIDTDCGHLLACLNMAYGKCNEGYCHGRLGDITARIKVAFREKMKHLQPGSIAWSDAGLQELWDALEPGDPPELADNLSLDDLVLIPLIAELLVAAGGERFAWYPGDEGGPGTWAEVELIYGANPPLVLATALEVLDTRLAGVGRV